MSIEWNDSTIAELRKLWNEGHSTIEIARRLGTTKNSCLGKAHRLDLPSRPSPIKRGGHTPSPRPPRVAGPTLPKLQSEVASGPKPGEWATEDRKEILRNLLPTHTSQARILDLLTQSPGCELPSWHAIASYANVQLKLRRPEDFKRTIPRSVSTLSQQLGAAARVASGQRNGVRDEPVPIERVRVVVAPKLFGRVVDCAWPIGEPGARDFRFCDCPSLPNRPYCEEHVKIAYVRVRDRREDGHQPGPAPGFIPANARFTPWTGASLRPGVSDDFDNAAD